MTREAREAIETEAARASKHRSTRTARPTLDQLGITRSELRARLGEVFEAYGLEA